MSTAEVATECSWESVCVFQVTERGVCTNYAIATWRIKICRLIQFTIGIM